MVKQIRHTRSFALFLFLLMLAICFAASAPGASAAEYDRSAELSNNAAYPGVYYVKAVKGDSGKTIGIPSIAKQNLTAPTTESPAIIMGAAVPYEKRTGTTSFEPLPGATLYPPYSYFRYEIINEMGPDGTMHEKMSGFDGSFVIIRVDVSDLIKDAPAGSYLHVKQEGNKALMVQLLYEKYNATEGKGSFSAATGNKTAVYAIDNGAVSLKDSEGNDRSTPYVDVIVYSSGTLVAGADTGSTDPTVANADFALKFYVDQTPDYDPTLDYDPNDTSTGTPTHADKVLAKFYDESKAGGATVTSYTIKGNDLELEIMHPGVNGGATEYWSLRQAMTWLPYDNTPIKMICEVPVLEGLTVDGKDGGYRHVIFDVNSFDIQIANHQQTGAAGLTVRNSKLTLMDSFNTTGAELAVGNNATMSIQAGGTLVIDESCQVEVEYDAASTAPGTEPPAQEFSFGVITIENGGEIINNGVISIEGTEGKPIDPAAPSIRDKQSAELHIQAGGKLTNNGCLLALGGLYNLGTIENNGSYEDTITSKDPDKGQFTYHKGIQVSWKDDVTQQGVFMGHFYNGIDRNNNVTAAARIVNSGDIVLVPGLMENCGTLINSKSGNIYLCRVDEAVIPVGVTWSTLIMEERIGFEQPISIYFSNNPGAILQNEGSIRTARVELVGNGRTGTLTPIEPNELDYDICLDNFGQMTNSGSIRLNAVYNFGVIDNSGPIAERIVMEANEQEGSMTDTAGLTEVYNAVMTTDGTVNTWRRMGCGALSVSPSVQYGLGGKTVTWTVKAETREPDAEGVRYFLLAFQGNGSAPKKSYTVKANEENTLTSPVLPELNGNAVYSFYLLDGLESLHTEAAVKLTSTAFTPPAAVGNLVYNGKDQALVTAGGTKAENETVMYRLGDAGEWSNTVPVGKNAGTYKVYYRLSTETDEAQPDCVDVVIAKRPVTVSGNDVSSQVGAELAELSWTVSGLLEGETLGEVQLSASTDANRDEAGVYAVTVTVTGENPNYDITAVEGRYTVTADAFTVVAKDKYGVFSDETTYKGFNIELTVPQGATAYYSTSTALTAENYQTYGMTALKNLPATAGTHTVYFYVTNGTSSVSGSKQVIIEKAQQTAPDSTKLITRSETWRNSEDGIISGLTARKMEYRDKYNDGVYALAYNEMVYVRPGTYLVRMAADENHYASADTEVVVAEGPFITISFDSNGGTAVGDVTGLSCGDQVPRPETDPTFTGWTFLGWFLNEEPYDFSRPVTHSATLVAGWAPEGSESFTLPKDMTVIEESAFEGIAARYIRIPDGCTTINPNAFKDCRELKFIRIPGSVNLIASTAFTNCSGVYVLGESGSMAETLCEGNDSFTFIISLEP